jgi:two-component sensor histidine kinase/CHASE3 domain sensor protein
MPLSRKLVMSTSVLLLALGFLTLIGIVGSTAWLGEQANSYFQDNNRSRSLRSAATDLRSALQSAESSQRGFLVGGNEIYLAPYDAAKVEAKRQFEQLKSYLTSSTQDAAIISRLTRALANKFEEMDRTIAAKKDGKEEEAQAIFRSNRGKALSDEINMFLAAVARQADGRLETALSDQRENATFLRLATFIGGAIIVVVVGVSTALVMRYASEIVSARNELDMLNRTLELRVETRTQQLAQARDRAEMLVAEINHRVSNSLALVASLVTLQAKSLPDEASKQALREAEARILAVASVHKRLYASGDAQFVDLREYLANVVEHMQASVLGKGHVASLQYDLESLKLSTDACINLGVIVTEWVTNAVKYAYPDEPGEVRVKLRKLTPDLAELRVEDDGVGRREGVTRGTGLGTRIVNAMARAIGGRVEYITAERGTVATLAFAPASES